MSYYELWKNNPAGTSKKNSEDFKVCLHSSYNTLFFIIFNFKKYMDINCRTIFTSYTFR